MITWVEDRATPRSDVKLSNVGRLFESQTLKALWLVQRGAKIHSGAIELLLWHKCYSDGKTLRNRARASTREDLE